MTGPVETLGEWRRRVLADAEEHGKIVALTGPSSVTTPAETPAPMPPAVWRMPGVGATVVDVRKLAAEALAVVLADTPEQAHEMHARCLALLDRLHAAGWALTPLPDHLKGVL